MPWHIEDDNSDCSGYAVVQDDNDRIMGCHDTVQEAEDQLAALYASEADKEKHMTRLNKTYEVTSFKALPGEEGAGRFEAKVSVFGNVDFQGDKVMDDAFDGSIERWQEKGDPIPVIWSHDWGNPHAHIGYVDPNSVIVDKGKGGGLLVAGSLDLDNPFAAQVYRLLKERRVKEFSFAYDVIREKTGRDRSNELHELEIIEVGPTLKGANPDTELLGVKSQLEEAAEEAREAGFDNKSAMVDRILQKAKTALGSRPYDEPTIPDEWSDLLDVAAGQNGDKNASNQFGGSFEDSISDPQASIDASIAGKSSEKINAQLPGSHEERQEILNTAARQWVDATYPAEGDDEYRWAYVCATFDDHMIVSVEIDSENRFFELPYTIDDNDEPTLGEPKEVEVEATLVPAAPKSVGSVTVDVVPVIKVDAVAAEDFKNALAAAVDQFVSSLGGGKSVTDPSEPVTVEDVTEEPKPKPELKDDPDADLKARLADLEATAGI